MAPAAPSVLLVDDDQANRRLLALLFTEEAGYDVLEARLGRDAIDEIGRAHPDLVILDMRLPDMDGLDVYAAVRGIGYEGPVLALTGSAAGDPLLLGARALLPPEAIMRKPFAIEELLDRAKALIGPTG